MCNATTPSLVLRRVVRRTLHSMKNHNQSSFMSNRNVNRIECAKRKKGSGGVEKRGQGARGRRMRLGCAPGGSCCYCVPRRPNASPMGHTARRPPGVQPGAPRQWLCVGAARVGRTMPWYTWWWVSAGGEVRHPCCMPLCITFAAAMRQHVT